MVNTDDFIKRLETVMEYYGHSSSSFADKIGVQRSSLSHLLSGRNKPSLDFILKIISEFPDVDLYWMLFEKGSFPKSAFDNFEQKNVEVKIPTPTLFTEEKNEPEKILPTIDEPKLEEKFHPSEEPKNEIEIPAPVESFVPKKSFGKTVEQIVILYTDGTFNEYRPNK